MLAFVPAVRALRLACLMMINGAQGFNFEIGPGGISASGGGTRVSISSSGGIGISHTSSSPNPNYDPCDACVSNFDASNGIFIAESGSDASRCDRRARPAVDMEDYILGYTKCMCSKVKEIFQCIHQNCANDITRKWGNPVDYAFNYCKGWNNFKNRVRRNGYSMPCTCEVNGVEPPALSDEEAETYSR